MSGLNGPMDWYVGYQGGGFTHSHLSPSPQPGRQGPAAPYVVMDSMLDDDRSVDEISRNPPAFPQNTMPPMAPKMGQLRPQLIDMTLPPAGQVMFPQKQTWAPEYGSNGRTTWSGKQQRSRMSPEQVAAKIRADNGAAEAAEDGGFTPTGMNGTNPIMGPDQLAGLGTGIDQQMPYANMQRPALTQAPEGIDAQFLRPNMVLRTDKGDSIIYKGLYSLAERPPIRPYDGLSGVWGANVNRGAMPGMGNVNRGALPGMGMMPARSISGPGVSELADLADDAVAPVALPAPTSSAPKLLTLAAVAAGLYLLLKRK